MRVDVDSSEAEAISMPANSTGAAAEMKMKSGAFKPHECNSRCA